MAVDFAKGRKQAEAAGMLGSGDYLKMKEGANRFRLMSECLPHPGEYKGKKNFKWLCYALDRADGKVKPYFMPHLIYKQIEVLQLSDDYSFVDVPMPYDLTIHAKGAGTIDVEYTLLPGRETPLKDSERAELAKCKPLAELQQALKEKKAAAEEPRNSPPGDVDFDPRDFDDAIDR